MTGIEKISIALTPEMAATINEAVSSGEYVTAGEVMRDAMREWQHHRKRREEKIVELQRLFQEGIDSGPSKDGKAFIERLIADIDKNFGKKIDDKS